MPQSSSCPSPNCRCSPRSEPDRAPQDRIGIEHVVPCRAARCDGGQVEVPRTGAAAVSPGQPCFGRQGLTGVEHPEAALRVHLDDLAMHIGPDQAIELGDFGGQVERLLGNAAPRRRSGDGERRAVIEAVENRARWRGEDRAAATPEELARLDVAHACAMRRCKPIGMSTPTMGDIADIEVHDARERPWWLR